MKNFKICIFFASQLLIASLLVSCASTKAQPVEGGPLEMSGPPEFGTRIVNLVAEDDGRERAVGNIRAVNSSENSAIKLISATFRDAQNAESGVFQLVRNTAETDMLGTGYPLPPLPKDNFYELSNPLWEASESATGTSVLPGDSINLIVGIISTDSSTCSVFEGVDVTYEAEGVTYRTTWKTRYVIELKEGSGCERSETLN